MYAKSIQDFFARLVYAIGVCKSCVFIKEKVRYTKKFERTCGGNLIMSKWCFNYDSGEYEDIDKDGYSWTRGEYVDNWDDSEYRREEEEEERRRREEEEEEERRRREEEEEEERHWSWDNDEDDY
jgi:hypothetical protein